MWLALCQVASRGLRRALLVSDMLSDASSAPNSPENCSPSSAPEHDRSHYTPQVQVSAMAVTAQQFEPVLDEIRRSFACLQHAQRCCGIWEGGHTCKLCWEERSSVAVELTLASCGEEAGAQLPVGARLPVRMRC